MTIMKNIALLLALVPAFIFAQYNRGLIPRASAEKGVSQKVGYTKVSANWNSPSVKGRKIWGELVAYNELWRAGANAATTIEFSTPVTIDNKKIDAGKYALFVIPNVNHKWTMILNKDHEQWGSYNYDPTKDVVRVDVIPRKRLAIAEDLTMSIEQHSFLHGSVTLSWEFIDLSIPFETDFVNSLAAEVKAKSESATDNAKWATYLQGADYLEELNVELAMARTWLTEAEKLFKAVKTWDSRYVSKEYVEGHLLWVHAKLLARSGETIKALEAADKVKAMKVADFYNRADNKSKIDATIEQWKSLVKK
jgi:hypothetical protein